MFRVTGHKMNDYRNAMLALRFEVCNWPARMGHTGRAAAVQWWQSVVAVRVAETLPRSRRKQSCRRRHGYRQRHSHRSKGGDRLWGGGGGNDLVGHHWHSGTNSNEVGPTIRDVVRILVGTWT